jgi:hypothetical protein
VCREVSSDREAREETTDDGEWRREEATSDGEGCGQASDEGAGRPPAIGRAKGRGGEWRLDRRREMKITVDGRLCIRRCEQWTINGLLSGLALSWAGTTGRCDSLSTVRTIMSCRLGHYIAIVSKAIVLDFAWTMLSRTARLACPV